MDPATACCPNLACHARGQIGQGNIGIHAQKDQRFLCTECDKTFSATTGTVFHRLRTSAETVVLVGTLRAHGCPLHAIVAALGFDERTVADWWARSGRQGQAVQEHLVEQPRDLGHVQADELRVKKQGGSVWRAMAMMVKPRLWLGGESSAHRARTLIRRLMERVWRCAAPRPLLVCTDGVCSYIWAMRETFRDPVHTGKDGRPRLRPLRTVLIAQVVTRYERRHVVETDRRIVDGPPARVETLRRRSHRAGMIHTADIERLNATFRERFAPLARRGRSLVRHTLTLEHGMYLMVPSTTSAPLTRVWGTSGPRPRRPWPQRSPIIVGQSGNSSRGMCRRLGGHHPSSGGVPRMRSNASWSGGAGTTVRWGPTGGTFLPKFSRSGLDPCFSESLEAIDFHESSRVNPGNPE